MHVAYNGSEEDVLACYIDFVNEICRAFVRLLAQFRIFYKLFWHKRIGPFLKELNRSVKDKRVSSSF